MDINNFIKNYRRFLLNNTNSKRAVEVKRYLYSDLKYFGVSVWQRRSFLKNYKKEIKNLSKSNALILVKRFWKMDYFEERAMALSILEIHSDSLDKSDMFLIEKMMRESRGWAFLDSLIIPLMPKLLEKDKSIYKYSDKWIKDKDFWVRRSSLLSQLELLRKGRGDRKLFFRLAQSQFDESWIDKEYKGQENKRAKFFIRKAIGWVLRDISKINPNEVYKFLKKNKNRMSGLSFREGSRKLPQSLKAKL